MRKTKRKKNGKCESETETESEIERNCDSDGEKMKRDSYKQEARFRQRRLNGWHAIQTRIRYGAGEVRIWPNTMNKC